MSKARRWSSRPFRRHPVPGPPPAPVQRWLNRRDASSWQWPALTAAVIGSMAMVPVLLSAWQDRSGPVERATVVSLTRVGPGWWRGGCSRAFLVLDVAEPRPGYPARFTAVGCVARVGEVLRVARQDSGPTPAIAQNPLRDLSDVAPYAAIDFGLPFGVGLAITARARVRRQSLTAPGEL